MDLKKDSSIGSVPCNVVNKMPLAFYESSLRKTSAEIISEAREAIKDSNDAEKSFVATMIKPLQTQRPFTPKDKERLLFGGKSRRFNRPPSAFRYLQPEIENANISTDKSTSIRNQALSENANNGTHSFESTSVSEINENIFNIHVKEFAQKVKLPAIDSLFSSQNRKSDKVLVQEENNFWKQQNNEQSGSMTIKKNYSLSDCVLLEPHNLSKVCCKQYLDEDKLIVKTANKNKVRNVYQILHDLNNVYRQTNDFNDNKIILALNELYECLENETVLNVKMSHKLKSEISMTMYALVESKNNKILLSVAKIILKIKATGNNLTGACKLIFKVSKNDKNDELFLEKNVLDILLDALGRSSPLDDAEACVYGYGAVKFLSMNNDILNNLLELGILQLMVLHLKIINCTKTEINNIPEQTIHVLYQITGVIRNLMSEDKMYSHIISCGTITQLSQTMDLFSFDYDIIGNISRTLSVISTSQSCCESLIENKNFYKCLINLFQKYPENEEIIIRLTYTLGNIVAKIDNSRTHFFEENNSVESLLHLWHTYLERTLNHCAFQIEHQYKLYQSSMDVMIKIIRVIANMIINPLVGNKINDTHGDKIVEELLKILISNPFKQNNDLVLSALSTLNNLTFYYNDQNEEVFSKKQRNIIIGILEYTRSSKKECAIESLRILGNLSRSSFTQNQISQTELFDILVHLLNTKTDLTLLKTAVGVFVNLMSNFQSRILFKNCNGVSKLILILTKHCEKDWLLGTLLCQVLWNYCIDTMDLYTLFSIDEIQKLLQLLADYLDEEKLFGIKECSHELNTYVTQEYLMWEEFANVATNLLEKIESFLEKLNDNMMLEIL